MEERAERGTAWGLRGAAGDVAHALRALRRAPAFAATAVGILALGIGAATATFAVVDGVLLRPLPVREQDRVAVVWMRSQAGTDLMHLPLHYTHLRAYAEESRAFEAIGGVEYNGAWGGVLESGGEAVNARWGWVTGEFFPALGVTPAFGRTLLPEDDVVGAEPVAMISHGFWQRRFGGDPAVLGRAVRWDDVAYTIVGVAPEGFDYPKGADLWAPSVPRYPGMLDPSSGEDRARFLDMVGRLRPGATLDGAREEFQAYLRRTDESRPAMLRGSSPVVTPLPEVIVGDARPALRILLAAVMLVLLLACINTANLLLLRNSTRVREMAIRQALGAERGHLARLLLGESAVLAVAGGVAGVAVAAALVQALPALAPPDLPRLDSIRLDLRVVGFGVAVTFAAALLSGVGPALWRPGESPLLSLRSGARVSGGGAGIRVVRQLLVVGQIALALVVLAGAGLLIRSLYELQRADMGLVKERLAIAQMHITTAKFADGPRQRARLEDAVARVRAIPGVAAVTPLNFPPFAGAAGWDAIFGVEGQTPEEQATNPWVSLEIAGPDHFRVMGIPIRRGRAFAGADREGSLPVAIVGEAVAEHFWPGEDPVGKRLTLGPENRVTVVGVAADTRYRELEEPRPTVYLPLLQFGGPSPMSLGIRTSGDPAAVVAAVRAALAEVDPDLALFDWRTMDEHLSVPLARPRFSAALLAALAAIALALAAVGIYGVMASFVRQRTRDIGIRLALGAPARDVRRLVVRQGLALTLAGCGVGLLATVAGTRLLAALLFGVSPNDPATLLAVTALLLLVGLAACYAPTRRATRVDPIVTLRAE